MYIRVTQGTNDPSRVDDVLALVRDAGLPAMRQQPGFRNAYVGVDRATGRGLVVSIWDTQEQANFTNSPDFVARLRAAAGEQAVAAMQVTIYEVTDQT
jgi:heme-degrading monooxygenase HmoA